MKVEHGTSGVSGKRNYEKQGGAAAHRNALQQSPMAPEYASMREAKDHAVAVNLPDRVVESVVVKRGEYDARRLRSQREVIRDVMLAAGDCDTWLSLAELHALTQYGEASISAQLRHLRREDNGGYDVEKRRREGAARTGVDGRGDYIWEYRIARLNAAGKCSMTAAAIQACK